MTLPLALCGGERYPLDRLIPTFWATTHPESRELASEQEGAIRSNGLAIYWLSEATTARSVVAGANVIKRIHSLTHSSTLLPDIRQAPSSSYLWNRMP